MSKQTLLFSFLDKSKCVNVESEIKGAEQNLITHEVKKASFTRYVYFPNRLFYRMS
jgi:hypothetical protein